MAQHTDMKTQLGWLLEAGVDFVVCGGVACVLHGVDRTTLDLDICVSPDAENWQRVVSFAKAHGLQPRIPEPLEYLLDPLRRQRWVEEKNAMVYTLVGESGWIQIDVFLTYPIEWSQLRSRAREQLFNGSILLISSKPDLIQAKRSVSPVRKKDLRDIEDLEGLP